MATDLLTATEAATHWGVSVHTVRRWANEGKIASVVLPSGRRRFRRRDVEGLLADPTEASA